MPSAEKSQLQPGELNGFTQQFFEIKSGAGFPTPLFILKKTISHGDSIVA
jgi:hypothetical protein